MPVVPVRLVKPVVLVMPVLLHLAGAGVNMLTFWCYRAGRASSRIIQACKRKVCVAHAGDGSVRYAFEVVSPARIVRDVRVLTWLRGHGRAFTAAGVALCVVTGGSTRRHIGGIAIAAGVVWDVRDAIICASVRLRIVRVGVVRASRYGG